YMPGLKALADRLPAGDASRSITLYTGSFSIGVGLSFLVSQLVADGAGWRAAFYVTSAGPFIMVGVCLWLAPCKPAPAHGHLLDFRPVLRNRAALGYILGYGAHCFELYGMRTGSSPSGPLSWRRATTARSWVLSPSASSSRCCRCPRACSAT